MSVIVDIRNIVRVYIVGLEFAIHSNFSQEK
jgi:hypothetical protein